MGKLSDYNVIDKLNEGIKVNIVDFDRKETGDWIVVASMHSDHFNKAKADCRRRIVERCAELEDKEKIREIQAEEAKRLQASLVIEWSLDDELTIENAMVLLAGYPPIREEVVKLAADTRLHIEKKLSSSTTSQEDSSN